MYNGQALCIHSLVPFLNLLDRFQFLEIDAEDYQADFVWVCVCPV